MLAVERLQIVRAANAYRDTWTQEMVDEKFSSSKEARELAWYASRMGDLTMKSDDQVKQEISWHFGFAPDEKINLKIIKSPDLLVVGQEYMLASNGYNLGKFLEFRYSPMHNGKCGCDGSQPLWVFEEGTRGIFLWENGVVQIINQSD